MKKVVITLIIFCLFLSAVSAISVKQNTIELIVDDEGNAKIQEKYELSFFAGERDKFKGMAEENSSSIAAWQADFDWFGPHFGGLVGENKIYDASISFDEDSTTFEYGLNNITVISEDALRETTWGLRENLFDRFVSGGLITISNSTKIIFRLPIDARISQGDLPPGATLIASSIVELSGINNNKIDVKYSIGKPITPDLDPYILIRNIVRDESTLSIVAVIGAIIVGIAYFKRKDITERLQNYIIDNSQIETRDPEEEIEIDVEA